MLLGNFSCDLDSATFFLIADVLSVVILSANCFLFLVLVHQQAELAETWCTNMTTFRNVSSHCKCRLM